MGGDSEPPKSDKICDEVLISSSLIHNFAEFYVLESMKIHRLIKSQVESRMVPGKSSRVASPRQVGKTTLLKDILCSRNAPFLFVSGEDRAVHAWLGSQSIETLRQNLGKTQLTRGG
ncbi:MAG: hypothetical protein R3C61_11950 [Bacteroidia bacterium]